MARTVRLLRSWEVRAMRQEMPRAAMHGWGDVALVTASGRSVCRCCGQRIKKGDSALVTLYSFDGSGFEGNPWNCVDVFIHAGPCNGEQP
jgi:hypothetical protein